MNSLFDAPWTHALGWTLIHSIWQIGLIAILYGIFRSLNQGASAQTRYVAGLLAFTLIMSWSIYTIFQQLPLAISQNTGPIIMLEEVQSQGKASLEIAEMDITPPFESRSNFKNYLQTFTPWMVIAWLLGICLMTLRFSLNVRRLYILRKLGIEELDFPWKNRLYKLAVGLGLSRVSIKLSSIIDQPLTLGFFKPLILIPSSMLTGFSPEEIESIFLHELAHIQRHDFLINLIQSLIELLFFFHPAIWWLSREIRHERELACDEFVIAYTKDATTHADALMHLQRYRISQKQSLALGAKGGKFSQRIHHLLQTPSKPDYRKGFLGMAIIFMGLLGISMIPVLNTEKVDNFQIEGKFTGFADSTWLYFGAFEEGIITKQSFDSAMVIRGQFLYTGHIPNLPTEALLTNKDHSAYTMFWAEPGQITIQGDSANLRESTISGSVYQDLWKEIERKEGDEKLALVEKNIDKKPAIDALYWLQEEIPLEKLRSLYASIPQEHRDFIYTKKIYNYLESRNIKKPEIGDPIVDFEAYDKNGKSYQLSAFNDRYTLIHFGHQPGFVTNDLPALAEEMGDQLRILSYSWDSNPERWRTGLDKLPAQAKNSDVLYLHDGEGEGGPQYPIYGDEGFPLFFLLNSDGIVVDKFLGTDLFHQGKWKEYLKKTDN